MDVFSKEKRSAVMARVRNRNTTPEITVRSLLHRLGYRFRLHRRDLPGTPDIVMPGLRTVIFVNGCFWHQHAHCVAAARPTSNCDYWNAKLDGNIARDTRCQQLLRSLGWRVVVVWECETQNMLRLKKRLSRALGKLNTVPSE
jgi:DNA mismatch endonuclease (patch repair protein)